MHSLLTLLASALLFSLFLSSTLQSQTADDLLREGFSAYSEGEFAKAEAAFSQFLADFGNSPEAKPAMEKVASLLILAQIQQQKFSEAKIRLQRFFIDFPRGENAEELAFWEGFVALQLDDAGKAADQLRTFIAHYPHSPKIPDAQLALGTALLKQNRWKDAAAHLADLAARSPPQEAAKAQTLQLYALVEMPDLAGALGLLKSFDPSLTHFQSAAAVHLLALQLGDAFLEKGQYRPALTAFQFAWPLERIRSRQSEKLASLETELHQAKTVPTAAAARVLQFRQSVRQIQVELARLEKIPDYDVALRLRIAHCFSSLERHRETAILLADAAKSFPDSPLNEQICFRLIHSQAQAGRWAAADESSAAFLQKFPSSPSVPAVLYWQGEVRQRMQDYDRALASFETFLKKYPQDPQAERVAFLIAYCLLMLERYPEALDAFVLHQKNHPKGALREASLYWTALAHSFSKDHSRCREACAVYLKEFPAGVYKGETVFRRAHSLYARRDFSAARRELEDFRKDCSSHTRANEAALLLGDCWFALGELDRGIAVFEQVPKAEPRLFDQAQFQIGKAYKTLEQPEKMRAHFQAFLKDRPDSPRIAEALHWIAWTHHQQNQPEEARELYWKIIRDHGNDPAQSAMEDIFLALAKLYPGADEKPALLAALSDLAEDSAEKKQGLLAARALWTQSRLVKKVDPARSRALLIQAGPLVKAPEAAPKLLADIGDAWRESGHLDEASSRYQDILSWFPRAAEKDRAYAGLGLIAREQGKTKAALDYFSRLEKEAGHSPLLLPVLKARASLHLERNRFKEAAADFEAILKLPAGRGLLWVEALHQLGEIHLRQGQPEKAIPYFQRIYVMYGRYASYVAKAYWKSGQAFEQLHLRTEAANTYREFLAKPELAGMEEFAKAKARLETIENS
jgi:TolA-binding protein